LPIGNRRAFENSKTDANLDRRWNREKEFGARIEFVADRRKAIFSVLLENHAACFRHCRYCSDFLPFRASSAWLCADRELRAKSES